MAGWQQYERWSYFHHSRCCFYASLTFSVLISPIWIHLMSWCWYEWTKGLTVLGSSLAPFPRLHLIPKTASWHASVSDAFLSFCFPLFWALISWKVYSTFLVGVSIAETCSHLLRAHYTELDWLSIHVWMCCTGVTYCTVHMDPYYVGPH